MLREINRPSNMPALNPPTQPPNLLYCINADRKFNHRLIHHFHRPHFVLLPVTQSEQDRSCILLVQMQRRSGDFMWVHVVLQVRDSQDSNQQPVIVCTNQVLR